MRKTRSLQQSVAHVLGVIALSGTLSQGALCAEDSTATNKKPRPTTLFESDVAPILRAYCWKCHGGEARQGNLDLRTLPLILNGGKSGPAVMSGSARKSLLYQKIVSRKMPPGDELKPTEEHIATIRAWIGGGALARYEGGTLTEEQSPPLSDSDRGWWSFRRPVRHPVPRVHQQDRVRTPVDAFVLEKLEEKGLGFSPDADRLTLIRRVYFGLIGLPPPPAAVDDFLADDAPDALERLVDRLLASPQYGERWGRHWLDAAGYVDTIGSDNDATIITAREGIWKYRDYVVRSFNDDKPYDTFLNEQIAGDELVDWRNAKAFTPRIRELLTATGFWRLAADVTYAPELNTADIRNQVLYNTMQILGSNLLGLTLQCAQCHTHKFDPISHADYYRMRALLTPAYDVRNWRHSKERFLHDVSEVEKQAIDAHNANVEGQIVPLKKNIAGVRRPFKEQLFDAKLTQIPEPIRADVKTAVTTPADKRNPVQKYLAEKLAPLLKVNSAEVDRALDDAAKKKLADLQRQIAVLQSKKQSYGKIQALWDVGPPLPAYLHRRGDYLTPGPEVRPGVIAVLDNENAPFALPDADSARATSGYRTALARWLTNPNHPLTARVIVNRVWQQHFGRGIVATPDNFGTMGVGPTHPQLLDWLATEFMAPTHPPLGQEGTAGGWSFKRLHRLIVTSTVYRQSSYRKEPTESERNADTRPTGPWQIDPGNHLLWRMPLRRLESEGVRDAILAVSGQLDPTIGGEPIALKPNPDGSVEIDADKLPTPRSRFRRSLYIFARRNYQLTELSVFDQPVVATNCTRRTNFAVVSQSLTLLNGKFIFSQASYFAARVRRIAGPDETERIQRAFRLALGREPSTEEIGLARDLLRGQATRYRRQPKMTDEQSADAALVNLCQMLFNTNEFLYVE